MKIVISNTVNMPIYEQVVNQIRDAVINGELKAGRSEERRVGKEV